MVGVGGINILAILLAVYGSIVFMLLWYGVFFWKLLEKYRGDNKKNSNVWSVRVVLGTFVVNLISITILSVLLETVDILWFIQPLEFIYVLWLWFAVPFWFWEVVVKNGSIWATFIELGAFLWELLVATYILWYFI
jgi:hypothetical protein